MPKVIERDLNYSSPAREHNYDANVCVQHTAARQIRTRGDAAAVKSKSDA